MRRSVRSEVDFVLTFEEMTGIFSAKHVDLENIEEDLQVSAMLQQTEETLQSQEVWHRLLLML